MGKAAAIATVQRGGKALLVSRSKAKLDRASKEVIAAAEESNMGGSVSVLKLDVTDELAVQKFAENIAPDEWDGMVISCAGTAPHGPIVDLPISETRSLMESKFWGAVHCSKYISPKLREGGSIIFVSGILGRRPGINCYPLATTNGALEGLTRSLALELGPRLRVNCLSPGFCATERFDHMDTERKHAMLENTAGEWDIFIEIHFGSNQISISISFSKPSSKKSRNTTRHGRGNLLSIYCTICYWCRFGCRWRAFNKAIRKSQ